MSSRPYDEEIAHHPHDGLVKRIFTKPEAAAVELRQALSPALTGRLDFSTLRVEPGSFVDPNLKPRHSDILYAVDLRSTGRPVMVYVLMEHQSSPDRMMAARFLGYASQVYDRYQSNNEGTQTLPLLVPLLLYQGPHGWTMPRRLSDLFDIPDELRAVFPPPIELVFGVDDLATSLVGERVSRDQLARDRGLALAEAVRTLLWLAHHEEDGASPRIQRLEGCLEIVGDRWGHDELLALITYVLSVFEPDAPLRGILAESANPETRHLYTTMRDEFVAKGRAEGHAQGRVEGRMEGRVEGRVEGRAEGRAIGMAQMVERLLSAKDLPLSDELRGRLRECQDEALLQRWFDRAFTATTLANVFGD